MSVIAQLNRYEKKLMSFHQYSFNNYSALQLIVVNLKRLLDNKYMLKNKQWRLDLLCEIENEIEMLENLRYADDINEDFVTHVSNALAIVKSMKLHLPEYQAQMGRPSVNMMGLVKRLFCTNLEHI
ncbi:hypothetical protein HH214_14445 [Mucilaginibacter robiniae]|uniref:Uncharacterized protein n=1 Tax=Mucilaginibacter robiniae TaxID=2728022 RepID=A0A7L5E0T6_9SPHI|nr:hypothetical protein [Mucilaginibacter robiniae]QJD96982.1 hypothetical protein HH214_14445 [Mucilaginibacter robiniae]